MRKLIIQGGTPLEGIVRISGAKNAALPILSACLLSSGSNTLANIPHLQDVTTMAELLTCLGAEITLNEQMQLTINTENISQYIAPYDLVKTMRASILVLGPLLSRFGHAEVSLPGGCAIGARPVDIHLSALEKMGATIMVADGFIKATCNGRLQGADIYLPFPTVTGTENIIMAATLAEGTTTIYGAAKEPEIADMCHFLNNNGAQIKNIGTDTISIDGVKQLSGCNYTIIPDRVEAATYLLAGAITRGHILLKSVDPQHLQTVISTLKSSNAHIETTEDTIEINMHGKQPTAVDITTAPYPLMPTDMQAQFMAMNVLAKGESTITETIFENRFMHALELVRMGADIQIQGNIAKCKGQEFLTGAPVMATDLRASASLVLSALMAKGITEIDRIYHIDRGYERIEEKLSLLGAKIERQTSNRVITETG